MTDEYDFEEDITDDEEFIDNLSDDEEFVNNLIVLPRGFAEMALITKFRLTKYFARDYATTLRLKVSEFLAKQQLVLKILQFVMNKVKNETLIVISLTAPLQTINLNYI